MNPKTLSITLGFALAFVPTAFAHLIGNTAHDGGSSPYDFTISPRTTIVLARADLESRPNKSAPTHGPVKSLADRMAASFAPFSAKVKTHADEKFFYVESEGLPAHNMMVGI